MVPFSAITVGYFRVDIYRVHIAPVLGNVKLTELTYRHVNTFYALLDEKVETGEMSPRTRAYIVWLLRSALDDAADKDILAKNAARKADRRTYKPKEAEFMERDEIERLSSGLPRASAWKTSSS
ncbi:hypothetical protein [Limnochorda pilosa]|uniref:Integrase n=1 Tax=Limnochorda pilosa TaxID=1555112 RepID=A0A0K2SN90_LIMPI|nr:hypothetical protein [Limnochorda pilosa]BAS28598.1 hypothetical protein LIP_2768 [Limnochorda pilosa]